MDEHSIDLVRDGLQIHVNEAGADVGNGGWLVAHYVAVVGLYRVAEDGSTETRPIVVAPQAQANYVTDGLLLQAPSVLDTLRECEDCDDCEPDSDAG